MRTSGPFAFLVQILTPYEAKITRHGWMLMRDCKSNDKVVGKIKIIKAIWHDVIMHACGKTVMRLSE